MLARGSLVRRWPIRFGSISQTRLVGMAQLRLHRVADGLHDTISVHDGSPHVEHTVNRSEVWLNESHSLVELVG